MPTVQRWSASHVAQLGAFGVPAPLSIIGTRWRRDARAAAVGRDLTDAIGGGFVCEQILPRAGDRAPAVGRAFRAARR
jgi:hypothetical protein